MSSASCVSPAAHRPAKRGTDPLRIETRMEGPFTCPSSSYPASREETSSWCRGASMRPVPERDRRGSRSAEVGSGHAAGREANSKLAPGSATAESVKSRVAVSPGCYHQWLDSTRCTTQKAHCRSREMGQTYVEEQTCEVSEGRGDVGLGNPGPEAPSTTGLIAWPLIKRLTRGTRRNYREHRRSAPATSLPTQKRHR